MDRKNKYMKKLTVFISVLLVSFSLFAIDTSLTFGYQDKNTNNHIHDPIYVSIDLWQDIGDFRIYGNYTNEMSRYKTSWMFSPSQDYFIVGATYDFKAFKITAEHMCQHSVDNKGIIGDYTKFEITIGDTK